MARLNMLDEEDPSPSELGKYRGEWVAVHGGRVIAHGLNPEKVFGEAEKLTAPVQAQPMIYRIPNREVLFH